MAGKCLRDMALGIKGFKGLEGLDGFKGLEGFRAGKRQTWTPIRSH